METEEPKKKNKTALFLIIGFIVLVLIAIVVLAVIFSGKKSEEVQTLSVDRLSKIPAGAFKITSATDAHPPILNSNEFETPVPLSDVINSAGAEDSAFIIDDKLYFFFTPDVKVPPEKQLSDEVTGIYVSEKKDGAWQEPKRAVLQNTGKAALDGCPFANKNMFWFCSTREGYQGINWFTAELKDGAFANWQGTQFPFEVGELHIAGNQLYFDSNRDGGRGKKDIWVSEKTNGAWQEPTNISAINTTEDERQPFLTSDGNELWYTGTEKGVPAVFRSRKINGNWQAPELIVSQFAAEPTLDSEGNLYFIHHYFKDSQMLEADIFFAKRK